MAVELERVEALLKKALGMLESDDPEGAVDVMSEALSVIPGHAPSVHVLGLAAVKMDELLRAEELLRIAHDSSPTAMEHAEVLAIVSAKLGRTNDAIFFGKLAASLPGQAGFDGLIPDWLGTFEEAVLAIDRRDMIEEGRNLSDAGRYTDALGKFRKAVEADSLNVAGWRGVRDTLARLNKPYDALLAGQALSSIGRSEPQDMSVVGTLLTEIGRREEGQACHADALEASVADPRARSAMIRDLALDPNIEPQDYRRAETQWETIFPGGQESLAETDPAFFRVGLLTASFGSARGAEMIWPVLAGVGAGQGVEVHVYNNAETDDTLARRIRGAVDGWTDIRSIDDRTVARIIANDRLDVLIDMEGHGIDGRPVVSSARPSKAVIRWFGEPGGSAVFDGYIDGTSIRYPNGDNGPAVTCFCPPPDMILDAPRAAGAGTPFRLGLSGPARKFTDAVLLRIGKTCREHPGLRVTIDPNALGGVQGAGDLEPRIEAEGFLDRVDYSPLTENPALAFDGFAENTDLVVDPGPDPSPSLIWECLSRSIPVLAAASSLTGNRPALCMMESVGLDDMVFGEIDSLFTAVGATLGEDGGYAARAGLVHERMSAAIGEKAASDASRRFFAALKSYVDNLEPR